MFSKNLLPRMRKQKTLQKIRANENEQNLIDKINQMEVSKEEAEMIWQGNCPCGAEHCLLSGPHGELSVNVKCEVCGQNYNIPPRPFIPEKFN